MQQSKHRPMQMQYQHKSQAAVMAVAKAAEGAEAAMVGAKAAD